MVHPAAPEDLSCVACPEGPVALVIDGNATSRRFVELALGRIGGFVVEAAQDAASAREILKAQPVDLIVCDTELDDVSGLAFFRSLQEQHRLRSVPFIFLSAERSVQTKVAAFKAGVDDYLVKPCDVAEVVARANALVARHRSARALASERTFNLAGDLAVVPFSDLVGIIEMGGRSGALSIVTARAVGQLQFDGGRVVHAVSGNLVGREAFDWLFRQREGHFEFIPGSRPVARTLEGSTTALLLEAARLFDATRTWEADEVVATQATTTRPPPPEHEIILRAVRQLDAIDDVTTTTSEPLLRPLVPALAPTSTSATQFERAIRDPYTLGELAIWTDDGLSEWTEQSGCIERLHIHLVAEMTSGVSALLSIAGAPSERWVLACLASGRKTLGLTFHLRSGKVLDIVLIDAMEPMLQATSLHRSPAVMLFCPPRGTLLSLGTGARLELEMLVDRVRPRAVLGLGNQSLSQLEAFRKRRNTPRLAEGDFTERADLRSLLCEGIRHWESTEHGEGRLGVGLTDGSEWSDGGSTGRF